jgi:cell wall-associated NlpC family hydrolase
VTPPLPPKEFSPVTSLLAEARQYLRTPYLFGGADPATGFDCSGFLTYVFNQTGLPALPRTSREQAQEGREIDKAEAKAGDLVYFSHDGTTVQHIGLVISNPGAPLAMIHASTSQGVIETNVDTSSYWNKRLVGLRRVIG